MPHSLRPGKSWSYGAEGREGEAGVASPASWARGSSSGGGACVRVPAWSPSLRTPREASDPNTPEGGPALAKLTSVSASQTNTVFVWSTSVWAKPILLLLEMSA